jgi:hypothetical protein
MSQHVGQKTCLCSINTGEHPSVWMQNMDTDRLQQEKDLLSTSRRLTESTRFTHEHGRKKQNQKQTREEQTWCAPHS